MSSSICYSDDVVVAILESLTQVGAMTMTITFAVSLCATSTLLLTDVHWCIRGVPASCVPRLSSSMMAGVGSCANFSLVSAINGPILLFIYN